MRTSVRLALCCAVSVVALGLHAPATGALPAGVAAEVVDLQGSGERKADRDAPWLAARSRDNLAGGAFVRTGTASRMALLFADETQVRLNQNSLLQVKEVAGAGRDATVLRLELGRAWSQAKRVPDSLQLETPSATAAIRGTSWELEVDASGRATLAVVTGTVEFFNAQGRVTVEANESAVAEVGKAPVKLVLTNPRDRVQWVNALVFDPRRYEEWTRASPALRAAIAAVERNDLVAARAMLEAERARNVNDIGTYAALGELDLVAGDFDGAIAVLRQGLQIAPRDPTLQAGLVRAQLLGDRVADAEQTLAQPRDAETGDILIAAGDTARRQGRATDALTNFSRATRVDAGNARAWHALGAAQNEREDSAPARRNLERALELDPQGAGFAGELGTLETFANRFAAARPGVRSARCRRIPPTTSRSRAWACCVSSRDDAQAGARCVAARGRHGAALCAREGLHGHRVLPARPPRRCDLDAAAGRGPRRQGSAAVAAVVADLHGPVPRGRGGRRIARSAAKRCRISSRSTRSPTTSRVRANLGFALAFFGLEDWALEVAQQSYYAYSGVEPPVSRRPLPGPVQQELGAVPGLPDRSDRIRWQQSLCDAGAHGRPLRHARQAPTRAAPRTGLWNPYCA